MIKSIGKLTLATILAALVVGVPLGVSAQDKVAPPSATPAAPKARAIPFHGKLASVDKLKRTITLDDKNKRTFAVTADTKITKAGKSATLDDGMVGEEAAGSYIKATDGTMSLKSLRFGAKAAK